MWNRTGKRFFALLLCMVLAAALPGIAAGETEAEGGMEVLLGEEREQMDRLAAEITEEMQVLISFNGKDVTVGERQDGVFSIEPEKLRASGAKLAAFRGALLDKQAAYMAEHNGEPLYDPEILENLAIFREWIEACAEQYEYVDYAAFSESLQKDHAAGPENGTEVTLPSFSFDELEFSEAGVRTEEREFITDYGSTVHYTYYYDAEGFLVYEVMQDDTERSFITRQFWHAKIGDTGYVAVKEFTHVDVKPGYTTSRNDFYNYFVDRPDVDGHYIVDENGKLVQDD